MPELLLPPHVIERGVVEDLLGQRDLVDLGGLANDVLRLRVPALRQQPAWGLRDQPATSRREGSQLVWF